MIGKITIKKTFLNGDSNSASSDVFIFFTRLLMTKIMTWKSFVARSKPMYSDLRPLLRPRFPRFIVQALQRFSERVLTFHQRGNERIETLGLFLQRMNFDEGTSISRLTTFQAY